MDLLRLRPGVVTGILILIFPRILNYIVTIYLIIAGLLGMLPYVMNR